jgi:hypothetical protein
LRRKSDCVLAIAGELKRDVDVIWSEKAYFETAHVAVARRAQVGNIHKRKPDVAVVRAEGSGLEYGLVLGGTIMSSRAFGPRIPMKIGG